MQGQSRRRKGATLAGQIGANVGNIDVASKSHIAREEQEKDGSLHSGPKRRERKSYKAGEEQERERRQGMMASKNHTKQGKIRRSKGASPLK